VTTAAAVLLGNDSGPGHLAALLGTPTITLFGPTSATVWRPLGPRARIIVGSPDNGDATWAIPDERVLDEVLAAANTPPRP
ncbi:MAG: glycosyltransferase family 9 protein, partial [Phycisphaerae bacterium]|nr:glycosyltransferase family 9 protein [Phycisphaerae bacterium]